LENGMAIAWADPSQVQKFDGARFNLLGLRPYMLIQ
jgi:hypothetical protein